MYTVSRKMGRKRQKLRSDADDRASVYAGYQRRGKIMVVLIGLVLIFKKQLTTLVNNIFQTISREAGKV